LSHDELQQRVNDLYTNVNEENPTRAEESKAHYALRAVVELHKPDEVHFGDVISQIECLECKIKYPCLTIQAIEKELS
jgi:hypothetical protein